MEKEKDIYICPTDGKKFKIVKAVEGELPCENCCFFYVLSDPDETIEDRCSNSNCLKDECYFTELPDNENE